MCIRCGENACAGERAYCASCVFALRAETESGFARLLEYLRAWAAFSDWCEARGLAPV
jgi:hypothetical protein